MKYGRKKGQSLVEITIGVSFLLILLLVLFEFAQIFFAYLNVLSAARAGCIFASNHPSWLREIQEPDYNPEDDPLYEQYRARITYEVLGADLNTEYLHIYLPVVEDGVAPGNPVTVRVMYELSTFASTMQVPFFGRFGLPNRYQISAQVTMPIRGE